MYKELSTAALVKWQSERWKQERSTNSERNTNRRHSDAKIQKLFTFWSTEKQLGTNMRQHKPNTAKSGLYNNNPNKHKQDKFRLVHSENRVQRTETPGGASAA